MRLNFLASALPQLAVIQHGGGMASTQLNFDLDEEEERGTLGAPVFGSPPVRLHDKRLDFSQSKDKSRVNQLKGRRRSTIGARGSPETNELIRYIAQQRLKTPPSTPGQTPTVTPHRSPFSHGLSSLKQKMASFQSLLEEEENQRPAGDGKADERATLVSEKENRSPQGNPVPAAPPSSKKRRTGPSRQVVKETREAACSAVDTLSSLLTPVGPKQMDVRQAGSEEPSCTELRGYGTEEAVGHSPFHSPGPRSSGCKKVSFSPTYSSPEGQRTRFSQYRSPCIPLTLGPVDSAWNEPLSLPSALLQTSHPAAAGEVSEKAGNSEQPKKKRVHFGVPLSPEFFDKRLPPSTPLQKGGTPAHLSGSGGSRLRSLLKTPQRSPLSLPQPDFNSPSLSGPSSPPPSGCRSNEMQAASTEDQEQISVSVCVTDPVDRKEALGSGEDAVCSPDVAPQVHEETTRRESSLPDATPEPPGAPSGEVETGAEPTPEPPSSTGAPARPRGRKRKQVTETDSAAARRPSRNAAISASGKMKGSAGKRRWGNKAVDRSLYGKRDFASKNPGLSPITETLSSTSRSPTPERRRASDRRAEDSGEVCDPSMPLVQTMADAISAASLWRRRFGDPSSEQEVNSRPEDCPVGEATGGDAPYDPDALPDGRDLELRLSEGRRSNAQIKGSPELPLQAPPRSRGAWRGTEPQKGPHPPTWGRERGREDRGEQRGGDLRHSGRTGGGGESGSGPAWDRAAPPRSYEAGETEEALPPWHQVEFSIEDVLQSQPTRGRRSVRRSLRNQSHTDPLASGLAWVPCSPAADRRSVRRQTRGRRSSTHAPPTLTEDPSL
ncbi:hypothetical protein GJAV_G00033200 [Gymnothorax javanicus]|nr:hypothetical protein GJAV_G00033200 [Gymnothorax javanicus]